jgi:hypothetical protein
MLSQAVTVNPFIKQSVWILPVILTVEPPAFPINGIPFDIVVLKAPAIWLN